MGLVSSDTLTPGATTQLRVTLNPLGKSGPVNKTLTLVTNDSTQPTMSVPVKADVEHWTSANSSESLESALFGRHECAGCHADPGRGRTGEQLYSAVCAMCHGILSMYAPSLAPKLATREVLRSWVADGRADKGMPGYSVKRSGPLTDAQIDTLVQTILQARKGEGQVEN